MHVLRMLQISREFLRNRRQRRIKLHKNMLDRGMLLMTSPAPGLRISTRGFGIFVKIEVGPLIGKTTFVFHLDADPHRISLIVSYFVDRTFIGGSAIFHNEHRLVWPFSGLHKFSIGPLRHKDVGEHLLAALRALAHPKAGGQKNPIAILTGGPQLLLSRVLPLSRRISATRR